MDTERTTLRRARPRHPQLRRIGRRVGRVLIVLVVLAVVARILAPVGLKRLINDRLARVPGYSGKVGDIDLALWRGAYVIEQIEVRKRAGEINVPFFSARRIDFSVSWRDLFRGRILSRLEVEEARLTLGHAATTDGSQVETDERWQDLVEDIFPIEIQRLEIRRGDLRYINRDRQPEVDVAIHDITLVATGLRNRRTFAAGGDPMPATVTLQGTTMGEGDLHIKAALAPLERAPYFDVEFALRGVQLTALNPFLRAYANVDVGGGTFDLFLEAAGRDGAFEGYVKPFFQDLDFENLTDAERSLPGRLWESIVAALNTVVKNHPRDQLGTRVPFQGSFEGTEVGILSAVFNTMRHGFGEAFSESLDGGLRPGDVEAGSAPESP